MPEMPDVRFLTVAEVASMYNFTNRMAMATNMLPNEEYAGLARPAA